MADHVCLAVASVDGWLEDFYPLTGNAGAVNAAYQFLRLAGEHTAAHHFYAASMGEDFIVGHTGGLTVYLVMMLKRLEHQGEHEEEREDEHVPTGLAENHIEAAPFVYALQLAPRGEVEQHIDHDEPTDEVMAVEP